MNIRKRHIHYNRALSDTLAKYVDRKNVPALRDEIARIVADEVIGVYITEKGNDFNNDLIDCHQAIQRGILTGKFDDKVIEQQVQALTFMHLVDDIEARGAH